MTVRLAQLERSFLARWVIATSVGWAAAAPLAWFVSYMLAVMEMQMTCERETIALCVEYGYTGTVSAAGFGEIMELALFSGVLFGLAARSRLADFSAESIQIATRGEEEQSQS